MNLQLNSYTNRPCHSVSTLIVGPNKDVSISFENLMILRVISLFWFVVCFEK